MTGVLGSVGPDGLLLVLLVAGHVAGDFLLQTWRMARGKAKSRALLGHFVLVGIAHFAFALPLLDARVALALLVVIFLHGLIDLVKARIALRIDPGRGLLAFTFDQLLHLGVIGAAWIWLTPMATGPRWIPGDLIGPTATGVALLAAYVFIGNGGSTIVRGVLAIARLERAETPDAPAAEATRRERGPGAGHVIGVLERTLALTLVLLGQWGALGLILAAKSVARFKELEDRTFSEYYLLGTLTSVTVAVAVGLLVRALL